MPGRVSSVIKYFVVLFVATFLMPSFPVAHGQEIKVAVLDMARIFGEYYKTKDAEKSLASRKDGARKEIAGQEAELKKLIEKLGGLQKSINNPDLSVDLKSARQQQAAQTLEEARALRSELLEFARRRELQLLEMFNRQRDVLLNEIRAEVTKHSNTAGYDLVLDKSARGTKGILFLLYSKDAHDFSSEMITKLNASAK